APERGAHVLVNGTLRHGVELLRSEGAFVRASGEGAMELAGALPEELRLFGINSADQLLEQRTRRRGLVLQIGFAGEDALIITADRVEREDPGVALIRDRALEQANNRRLRFRAAIFDRAEKRRDVRELRSLGKKTRHFDVGVNAILEFPVKLQKEFIFEEHRRIALLRAQDLGRRRPRFAVGRESTAR